LISVPGTLSAGPARASSELNPSLLRGLERARRRKAFALRLSVRDRNSPRHANQFFTKNLFAARSLYSLCPSLFLSVRTGKSCALFASSLNEQSSGLYAFVSLFVFLIPIFFV
jgi:hypothetical protein